MENKIVLNLLHFKVPFFHKRSEICAKKTNMFNLKLENLSVPYDTGEMYVQ